MANYFGINTSDQTVNMSIEERGKEVSFIISNNSLNRVKLCARVNYISGEFIPYNVYGADSIELDPNETTRVIVALFPSSLMDSTNSEFVLTVYDENNPDEVFNDSPVIQLSITGRDKKAPSWISSAILGVVIGLGIITVAVGVIVSLFTYNNHQNKQFIDGYINSVYFGEYEDGEYLGDTDKIKKRSINHWKNSEDRVEFFQSVYNVFAKSDGERHELYTESNKHMIAWVLGKNKDEELNLSDSYRTLYFDVISEEIMNRIILQAFERFDDIYNPEELVEIMFRIVNKYGAPAYDLEKIESHIENKHKTKYIKISLTTHNKDEYEAIDGYNIDNVCDSLGANSKYISKYKREDGEFNFWIGKLDAPGTVDKLVISDLLESYDNLLKQKINGKIKELDKFYISEDKENEYLDIYKHSLSSMRNYVKQVLKFPDKNSGYETKVTEANELIKSLESMRNIYFEIINHNDFQKELILYLRKIFTKDIASQLYADDIYLELDRDIIYGMEETIENVKTIYKEYQTLISSKVDQKYDTLLEYYLAKESRNKDNDVTYANVINSILFLEILIRDDYNSYTDLAIKTIYPDLDMNFISVIDNSLNPDYNKDEIQLLKRKLENEVVDNFNEISSKLDSQKVQDIISDSNGSGNRYIPTLNVPLTNFTVTLEDENSKKLWSRDFNSKGNEPLTLIPKIDNVSFIKIELNDIDYLQISDVSIFREQNN